ncbi:helix-turn-helix transcriptional regulator [Rhodocytophaga rosea]|uniref:Helix-turn-helix transcriptional regulator n=1 Tax=Rhodocytophaga rosea TaxID=2704465 RepID=A0A6C0GLN6_9BACT|nr:helix-turn-helix transcriptional regulator [Rhodocytophaga rosea]QHT68550.1 helix-turn-helix transcriptional regulator [Rhodocytophaga rosea]
MLIKNFPPSPALREYISKYQVTRLFFDKNSPLPIKYHTPHPEHCITFYARDKQRYSLIDSPLIITYPRCAINGMYDVPINRYGGHDFVAIKVVMQPGILLRLTGILPQELSNSFVDAENLWGKEVRITCERLINAQDLPEMFSILEIFFNNLFMIHLNKKAHPVDKASLFILNQKDPASLEWLADQSCLSKRQFIRKFEERQGISPKSFDRITRFDRAYRMKNAQPT